jgi:hypothetical protein
MRGDFTHFDEPVVCPRAPLVIEGCSTGNRHVRVEMSSYAKRRFKRPLRLPSVHARRAAYRLTPQQRSCQGPTPAKPLRKPNRHARDAVRRAGCGPLLSQALERCGPLSDAGASSAWCWLRPTRRVRGRCNRGKPAL